MRNEEGEGGQQENGGPRQWGRPHRGGRERERERGGDVATGPAGTGGEAERNEEVY